MTSDLRDKTAIVTGGGRGIGRGIALALAANGAAVVIGGRSLAPLQETVAEIEGRGGRARAIPCDVRRDSDLEELVQGAKDRFGSIDCLVNNAMQVPHGPLLDIAADVIDAAWTSGPLASLKLMRLCHPHLVGGGSIVNISSGSSLTDRVGLGMYAATKAALNSISRAAAVEWGADGIRVNVVMPFGKSDSVASFLITEPGFAEEIQRTTPLGRVGDPEEDIGRVVAFLCSAEAGYITGAVIPADGGRSYLR
jgi:meso-butanediol dehydrogenase / (S,S)-butanediol dehydrogenase / diacetyl reductase